jgi:hypothetical protein
MVRLVIVLLSVLAIGAQAGVLAPRKASDLVVVEESGSGDCPVGTQFGSQILPDGTTRPFVIPNKRVLVVTDIEILGFGGAAGTNNQVRVFAGTPSAVNQVLRREQRFDADGRVFYVIDLDPGFVVPSGGVVCMNNSDNVTLTGFLRGYVTRAK